MTSISSRIFFGLFAVILVGCQLPLNQAHSGVRPFSLKLSLSTPSLTSGERDLASGRVLLPTAVRVDVEVKNEGLVVAQKSATISAGSAVAVLQLEVLKTYDLTAKAFDAAENLVFAGSTQLILTGDLTGVLNLYPILTDAKGKEVPWPTVAPTPAQQPAGSSVTQGVSLKAGESTSFLLDFATEASEFTFATLPEDLEVYLQKVAGGGVLTLPATRKLTKADSPEGAWVTFYARKTPVSQATLGRFTIPTQSFTLSGPVLAATNTNISFTLTSIVPSNATNAANDDFDWSASGALTLVSADASGATFQAAAKTGTGVITVTSKLTPSVSKVISVPVTDPPVAGFDVITVLSASSTVVLAGTADSGATGSGIAEVWLIRDAVGAPGHETEDPKKAGWTKATLGNSTATGAAWSATFTGIPDGPWQIWAKAVDKEGKVSASASKANLTVDTIPPLLSETGIGVATQTRSTSWIFSGSSSDATSGLETLTVKVGAGAPVAVAVTAGTWNFPVSALPPEGLNTYLFTATDKAGNVTTVQRDMTVDATGPTLTETGIGVATQTRSTTWTFSGVASDATSGLNSLTVTVGAAAPVAVTVTAGTWSFPVSSLPADGLTTYLFTATDNGGKVTTVQRDITIDTTVPSLTEAAIGVASQTRSTAWTFSGAASDATSGLNSLTVKVGAAAPVPVTVTAGTWSFPVSSLPADGLTTYLFTATDNVGKVTTLQRDITIDTTVPLLTETGIGVTTQTRSSVWTFSGAASDATSGLNSLTVKVGAAAPVPVTVTAGTWSFPVSSLPADGLTTYLFTATDNVGKSTTLQRDITVDTTAPVVTIGSPTELAVIAGTKVSLVGTANDALSVVTNVEFQVDGGAWTPASGTTSWTADATGISDGAHVLRVRATDALGNTSTSATVNVTVKNSVGITFAIAGYQHLAFSPTSLTITAGSQPTVSTSDSTLLAGGSNWKWWVDGVLLGSSASFTLPPTIKVGFHTVSVFVTYTENGSSVDYSQSFDLMVNP